MPLLLSGRVALKLSPSAGGWVGGLVNAPGVPATTLESPRGTRMYGRRSVCWSAGWPVAGVAMMLPRDVRTAPTPMLKVSSLGRAANAAAVIESATWTVALPPAMTVTLVGLTVMVEPAVACAETLRL